jgi:hypothetical protein
LPFGFGAIEPRQGIIPGKPAMADSAESPAKPAFRHIRAPPNATIAGLAHSIRG